MRKILILLLTIVSMSLSAQEYGADKDLFEAYKKEDMSVWKRHLDSACALSVYDVRLMPYEYGYCGYIVSADKAAAKPYVAQFKKHVERYKSQLPKGHYEMYMSAVYVFELRLHESFHPAKGMSLAKDAVEKSPNDPMTLTYYGTSLFYAPRPFGSKKEALEYFEKADKLFKGEKWRYCWLREANTMYIRQCKEKLSSAKMAGK